MKSEKHNTLLSWNMHTWIGGISGRQGRFSGLVTEGMSSMGPIMGLAGLRWAWAPAILALVGLVGLALCREATGKGPACPGFECCTKRRRERAEWSKENKKTTSKKQREDTDRKRERQWKHEGGKNRSDSHLMLSGWKRTRLYVHAFVVTTHAAQDTNDEVRKKGAKPLIVVRNETFGGSSQIL